MVLDNAWRRLIRVPERVVARALAAVGEDVAVVLADDRAVKRLNARHQAHGPVGSNRPTNVLTFPGSREIVLARGVLAREAAASRRRPEHHLAHLVVHGALHVAGHDHLRAGEARRMELAEARALSRARVPNPWRLR